MEMDDNTYWISFFKLVSILAALFILTIGSCTVHQNNKIAEAIKNGVSPERARIAYSSQTATSELIAALLAEKLEDCK